MVCPNVQLLHLDKLSTRPRSVSLVELHRVLASATTMVVFANGCDDEPSTTRSPTAPPSTPPHPNAVRLPPRAAPMSIQLPTSQKTGLSRSAKGGYHSASFQGRGAASESSSPSAHSLGGWPKADIGKRPFSAVLTRSNDASDYLERLQQPGKLPSPPPISPRRLEFPISRPLSPRINSIPLRERPFTSTGVQRQLQST